MSGVIVAVMAMLVLTSGLASAGLALTRVDPNGTPVFALVSGDIAKPHERDTVPLVIDAADYTGHGKGEISLGLLVQPAAGSALRADISAVRPVGGSHYRYGGGARTFAFAAVRIGRQYTVTIEGVGRSTGGYELLVFLSGDANGDFAVDGKDVKLISSLRGARLGGSRYSRWADIDQNGVIDHRDVLLASHNQGAATRLRLAPPDNPLDTNLPEDSVTVPGVSTEGFNASTTPVRFAVKNTTLAADHAEATVRVNGVEVPAAALTVASDGVTMTSGLGDGRNDIEFTAYDSIGRNLYHNATIWAGDQSVRVLLVDGDSGLPFTAPTTVRLALTDDASVGQELATSTGEAVFTHVPLRTVLVRGTAGGNRFGTVGGYAGDGVITLRMLGFAAPSTVDNNDFSAGTAGWNIGTAAVSIAPHVEGVPAPLAGPANTKAKASATPTAKRTTPPAMTPATPATLSAAAAAADPTDNDLTLATSGEGEQAISRTFATDPAVTGVRVRYRFITTEVPGGYFGTKFNDYFRVAVRTQGGGGAAAEANSMNGLGLGEFDFASGATAWREVTLNIDQPGDVTQVDLAVANVADGQLDSRVVVDSVDVVKDQVKPALAWDSTGGGLSLTYTVEKADLNNDATISLYWAKGTTYASRIGGPITTVTVPAGTKAGPHGPLHIAGTGLANDPAGATHLVAASSPTMTGSLADVHVGYGASAKPAAVLAKTLDIIKDGLRAAGQANATITSTARTPSEQARVMFDNLVLTDNIAANIASQKQLYAAPGDAVVSVFEQRVTGLTRAQILAQRSTIQDAMLAEIVRQGPTNVSKHTADPAVRNVVDIGKASFNANNRPLFTSSVQPRVDKLLDETKNNCYHLEVLP